MTHLVVVRLEVVVSVGDIHVFYLTRENAFLAQVPLKGGSPAAHLAAHTVVRTHQLVVLRGDRGRASTQIKREKSS